MDDQLVAATSMMLINTLINVTECIYQTSYNKLVGCPSESFYTTIKSQPRAWNMSVSPPCEAIIYAPWIHNPFLYSMQDVNTVQLICVTLLVNAKRYYLTSNLKKMAYQNFEKIDLSYFLWAHSRQIRNRGQFRKGYEVPFSRKKYYTSDHPFDNPFLHSVNIV